MSLFLTRLLQDGVADNESPVNVIRSAVPIIYLGVEPRTVVLVIQSSNCSSELQF